MNKRHLTALFALLFFSPVVSKTYCCPDPPDIRMVDDIVHQPLAYFDNGEVILRADCDSGGPIDNWVWSEPTESIIILQQCNWDDHSTLRFKFNSTGKYTISVKGYNGELYGSDSCAVYVFEMDLDVDGVDDEDEEDPGKLFSEGDVVQISLSYEPSTLWPGYIELKIPYGGESRIRVWEEQSKVNMVIPDGSNPYKRWLVGTQPSTLWVEGYSTPGAELWLLYSNSTDPNQGNYPGGDLNHDPLKFTIPWMKIEKVGNTLIDKTNNYSEDTTIRVTAVNANGQTYESFTGTVNIAEDTSGQDYVEIYSQNGGYLPSSVNITSGGTNTFVAKSLANPKNDSTKPDDALIITTNHDVYNEQNCLHVPQWTNDLGQVHSESDPDKAVYDWLETMIKDMWTTSGDLGTVLGTVDVYWAEYMEGWRGAAAHTHTATSVIKINPYSSAMRLNGECSTPCGQPDCPKCVNNTVVHEARHCYQNYLTTVDLGQTDDIAGKPNNDDDQDWLVETVPIGPTIYILDTNGSRATCAGNKSFNGDATADTWDDNVEEAAEKDANEYATANDD